MRTKKAKALEAAALAAVRIPVAAPGDYNIVIEPASGGVTAALGFKAAGIAAGIKESGKPDLAIVFSDRPASGAGMFTTNSIRAACVKRNERILPEPYIRAFVCNSGNANACTGPRGMKDARLSARTFAKALGVAEDSVLTASTGVIGKFLPMEKILEAVPKLAAKLSPKGGAEFAEAIMTTDTVIKEAAARVTVDGKSFTIGAAAKGSGMIHPNMATMLCFITTDAGIEYGILSKALRQEVELTLNNVTIDGDTSTNDMALIMANGESGVMINKFDRLYTAFQQGLHAVCADISKQMADDGEGATKRVEIIVKGGQTTAGARNAAKAVATSNLTKCALFGNDPNWGRIACAVGYSKEKFNKNKLTIDISGVRVFEKMMPADFNAKKVSELMNKKVVTIEINLGAGDKEAIIQTCDLSYDYIKINADYHT